MADPCVRDSDCADNELCYDASFPWIDGDDNICDCNSWFGWGGEDCLKLGRASYYVLTSAIVTLLLGLASFILISRSFLFTLNFVDRRSSGAARNSKRRRSSVDSEGRKSSIRPRNSSVDSGGRKNSVQPRKSTATQMETTSSGAIQTLDQLENEPRRVVKRKKKKKKLYSSLNATLLLCWIASIFYITWRISVIVLILTPGNLIFREEEGIEGLAKAHYIEENVERYLVLVSGIFLVLGSMNLSLVWIDNSKKLSKMVATGDQVLRYKYVLLTLDVIWIALFLVLPPAYAGGVIIFIFIALSISYFFAARYMQHFCDGIYGKAETSYEGSCCPFAHYMAKQKKRKSIMEDMPLSSGSTGGSTEKYMRRLVDRMKQARRRIIIGSLIAILGTAVYSALSLTATWRKHSVPGNINLPMVGTELLVFGIGFNLLAVVLFLHQTACR